MIEVFKWNMGGRRRGGAREQPPSSAAPHAYEAQHLNVRGKLKHFSITGALES